MSNNIYGFYVINGFINNAPNVVNAIGELGNKTATYSRDVKQFPNAEGIFNLFSTTEPDDYVYDRINIIGNTISTLLNGLSDYTINGDGLLDDMERFFGEEAITVSVGPGILNTVDSKLYPSYIEFTKDVGSLDVHVVTVKIWLSNLHFRDEYPNGTFNLIYPISNLQTLYDNYSTCRTQVLNLSATFFTTKLTQDLPGVILTGTEVFTVTVHNRLNDAQSFEMPILVAFNGNANYCNEINYTARLVEDLLDPGLHNLDDWNSVIHLATNINEYFIIPRWNDTAVSNNSLAFPIYTPSVAKTDLLFEAIADNYFPDFTLSEVEDFIVYTTAVYKSLGFYALPALNNPDGRLSFKGKWEDYFVVKVNDPNIGQMGVETRQMAVLLDSLLIEAERYALGDTLSVGTTVVSRNDMLFLTRISGSIKLSVLARMSVV
jgi:hypothetical protein